MQIFKLLAALLSLTFAGSFLAVPAYAGDATEIHLTDNAPVGVFIGNLVVLGSDGQPTVGRLDSEGKGEHPIYVIHEKHAKVEVTNPVTDEIELTEPIRIELIELDQDKSDQIVLLEQAETELNASFAEFSDTVAPRNDPYEKWRNKPKTEVMPSLFPQSIDDDTDGPGLYDTEHSDPYSEYINRVAAEKKEEV